MAVRVSRLAITLRMSFQRMSGFPKSNLLDGSSFYREFPLLLIENFNPQT